MSMHMHTFGHHLRACWHWVPLRMFVHVKNKASREIVFFYHMVEWRIGCVGSTSYLFSVWRNMPYCQTVTSCSVDLNCSFSPLYLELHILICWKSRTLVPNDAGWTRFTVFSCFQIFCVFNDFFKCVQSLHGAHCTPTTMNERKKKREWARDRRAKEKQRNVIRERIVVFQEL